MIKKTTPIDKKAETTKKQDEIKAVKKEDTQISEENKQGASSKGNIVFYCKNCKELISAEKIGKKYQYKCPLCKEKDVAFGTERSIKNVYKV